MKKLSRWNRKKKGWYDRKSRKGNKRKTKRKRLYRSFTSSSYVLHQITKDQDLIVTLKPPKNFSLINNTEETMAFFSNFANEINYGRQGMRFFIDSREVESPTVDALIYLIAILQNDTVNSMQQYSFAGNYPVNSKARRVYTESGFTDYVNSEEKNLHDSNDKKRITCGIQNDSAASKELCDFVMQSLGKSRRDIQPIQKVLIELMSNVYHHAYEKNTFMAKKWYMYAEHVDDYVRCVFVDTGFGIARTARKNLGEKLRTYLGIELDDAKIIQSIFNGKFRTATNERFRGNGLSSVRENVKADIFKGLEVISGKGRCIIPKNAETEEIVSHCYKNRLYGTLFQFVVK